MNGEHTSPKFSLSCTRWYHILHGNICLCCFIFIGLLSVSQPNMILHFWNIFISWFLSDGSFFMMCCTMKLTWLKVLHETYILFCLSPGCHYSMIYRSMFVYVCSMHECTQLILASVFLFAEHERAVYLTENVNLQCSLFGTCIFESVSYVMVLKNLGQFGSAPFLRVLKMKFCGRRLLARWSALVLGARNLSCQCVPDPCQSRLLPRSRLL